MSKGPGQMPETTDALAPAFEAQYNNRAAVPDHPAVIARWRDQAQAARAAHPPEVIAYGKGEREKLDLFEAPAAPDGKPAPVVVFIHGGYWQALDRSFFSWIAPALLHHGVSLAVPSYDLCPDVSLSRIVGQMRTLCEGLRERSPLPASGRAHDRPRPLVTGHSAGGHMAACLLSEGRASGAVAISGVFDLRPLVHTSLNTALQLHPNQAAALSPIFWPIPNGAAPGGTALDCIVGAAETDAFIDQSRQMAEHWSAGGAQTRFETLDGLNHFTVLDPLADPHSPLIRRIVELAKA